MLPGPPPKSPIHKDHDKHPLYSEVLLAYKNWKALGFSSRVAILMVGRETKTSQSFVEEILRDKYGEVPK